MTIVEHYNYHAGILFSCSFCCICACSKLNLVYGARYKKVHTRDDKYCADVIRLFLMSGKNLNISNVQSDINRCYGLLLSLHLSRCHYIDWNI